MYVMNDAKKYNTILVLEDDFMFNPQIDTGNIDTFVSTHTKFIYRLGCIPYVQVPYNGYTYVAISAGTHAVLLSHSVRQYILHHPPEMDWDMYLNTCMPNFIYYRPLCYQLFPTTENQKNWGNGNKMFTYVAKMQIGLFQLLRLDKQVDPGYTIMYIVSKCIPWILIYICFKCKT
jgi:GR25 family glycosyltransferase involved in LPS biosynthesis